MDPNKWKSTAIAIETHKILKGLSIKKHRSVNAMIRKLVFDYIEFQADKKGLSVDDYIKLELEVQ
mgnify:CR=1 FL=1|jgi:hypothetical protein|tara:strand:- start:117 stop:311 length:195 start_codon:yes stop_codon:yes gene_type:complete